VTLKQAAVQEHVGAVDVDPVKRTGDALGGAVKLEVQVINA
jgi:hypothetical protein